MKNIMISFLLMQSLFATITIELACDQGYPPYSYKENKVAKGVYVDIIKKAFSKIPEYDVKFKTLAWSRMEPIIKSGKMIGHFPPYYNKESTPWTELSEPILNEKIVVFAKENIVKEKKNFPEDYKNLTMCLNRGFPIHPFGNKKFGQMIVDKEINVKRGNDNETCLNQVSQGKADFYLNDHLINIKQFPLVKKGVEIISHNRYIGFTKEQKDFPYTDDVRFKFNKVINEMKSSGEILEILNTYK